MAVTFITQVFNFTRHLSGVVVGTGRRHARALTTKVLPYNQIQDGDSGKELRVPHDFRTVFPEFLPDPKPEWRNRLREKLERRDMVARRCVTEIPEFYVGSIMAVTVADINASGKTNRFVGICIQRGGTGLRAWFILRNVIDHQGVEIMYEMYSPLIQTIDVLRLEKRLDDELLYLRDALPEYSTFPLDMEPELVQEGAPVPVNPLKVQLKPRPWHERWERKNLQGLLDLGLPERFYKRAKLSEKPWEKFDLMKEYRATIPEEEQADIFRELSPHYHQLEASRRRAKRRRTQVTRS
ncbi:39S ribosomal protein L19, mitochondrial-like [Homarus americanus]|uniref:39S ribosomal protein L19, mitochondrial-like n=1 Tax=Homarus americanus TaxID=6706 RepID=UPI001C4610A1|nr:39S ribosomal protein L19, mitochondrial-like [Homarus americanus]